MEIQTAPGVWLDITDDVYQRDSVRITQGKSDEQSQAQPGSMMFTLDNRDGKYSPRNPLSPLYGLIGRNTPVRCKLENGTWPRFYGEISSWPPKWDPSHSDNFVPVEAYGILRRLGQGQPTISNALKDWVLAQPTLAAYYPLGGGEDTTYSQNLAPGKTGSFRSSGATFKYGVDMGAPWLGTGMELSAAASPNHMEATTGGSAGSSQVLDFVFRSDGFGVLDVKVWPTYDSYWNLRLNTSTDDGTLQVSYYDDANGLWTDTASGPIPELQDSELHTCRFVLRDTGGGTTWFVYIDGGAGYSGGAPPSNPPLTNVPLVWFYYTHYTGQTVVNLAHVTLWADNTLSNIPAATDYYNAAFAYAGETATARITRVATDGGISVGVVTGTEPATTMGPQYTESRLEQIRDAETTDMGILYEHRVTGALMYKSRSAMYNYSQTFALDYSAGHVSPPLEPVDDDQTTRNDVTATRREGSSARYTVDMGPMSTQDPPDGVGRYDTEITVNVETDGMLDGVAAWVANLGTLDKARWPSVTVNLNNPRIPSTLRDQIRAAGVGDWFTIKNMKQAYVYDDVTLIIVGYSETIDPFSHIVTFNCMPADPYTVAVYDTSRYDADGSTLTSNVTATATSISATKGGTTLWTTDAAQMPFDIRVGGERMTVTNITGSSSPQTMTVTRSVNGVSKAQTAGTAIELWDTPRYAL
jgi:hypothetical protein